MNDVTGMIEDVEKMAIVVPQILTQMVVRTADVPQTSTVQQPVPEPQDTTSGRLTISSVQLQAVEVQVTTRNGFSQVPVPVVSS